MTHGRKFILIWGSRGTFHNNRGAMATGTWEITSFYHMQEAESEQEAGQDSQNHPKWHTSSSKATHPKDLVAAPKQSPNGD